MLSLNVLSNENYEASSKKSRQIISYFGAGSCPSAGDSWCILSSAHRACCVGEEKTFLV